MAQWSKDTPPNWRKKIGKKEAVATKRGWEDPDTGEVLVAISNLTTKAGAADILEVRFVSATYDQSDPISVIVRFNESVDVTAGLVLTISSTGLGGNFDIHADAQSGHEILFDLEADLLTPATVPAETADLSIAAQTLSGTVVDTGTATASNLAVSAGIASDAGTRSVA